MNRHDPLEALLYNSERDGPLPTVSDIAAAQSRRKTELLHTPGIEVMVLWREEIPIFFRKRRGVVIGHHKEKSVGHVIDVQIPELRAIHYFRPDELMLRRYKNLAQPEEVRT